jgi:tetratricopeptide (TPR) repeat protein
MAEERNVDQEIREWGEKLRKSVSGETFIKEVQERLDRTSDADEKSAYFDCLDEFYVRAWDVEAQRQIKLQRLAFDPDDHVHWISLAEFERMFENFRTSLAAAERAVALTKKQKAFQRLALGTKARTLRDMGRYEELDACLIELVELVPKEEEPDFPPEGDFFRKLDKSKLSPETVKLYQDYLDRWKGKTHPAWGGLAGA